MIQITDKRKCTGCGACAAACPLGIIHMTEDEEGFKYPQIDVSGCIGCNQCNKVCSMFSFPDAASTRVKYYAAFLKDKKELLNVSSGGAFWGVAQTVLEYGGIVYGAVQTDINTVRHQRATNLEEAKPFRKSKYLQSDITGCFKQVAIDLENQKQVLFTGTACQIAALKKYVGSNPKNLITCDIVCHGVPSLKAYMK